MHLSWIIIKSIVPMVHKVLVMHLPRTNLTFGTGSVDRLSKWSSIFSVKNSMDMESSRISFSHKWIYACLWIHLGEFARLELSSWMISIFISLSSRMSSLWNICRINEDMTRMAANRTSATIKMQIILCLE